MHRLAGTAHQVVLVRRFGHVERMMRHHDPGLVTDQFVECRADLADLPPVHPAALVRQRARRVDAEHRDLVVHERGREVVGDVAPVAGQRLREPRDQVDQRNIVIPGHHDLRLRQRIEKGARLLELRRAGPLREVAGDCDEVGLDGLDRGVQRRQCGQVHAPEVQVRQVDDGAHRQASSGAWAGAGTATRSAPFRIR